MSGQPKRIQMTRNKPWRADNPDAVIVARPSKWGNPFRVKRSGEFQWVEDPNGDIWGGTTASTDRAGLHREMTERAVELFATNIGPMGVIEYDADRLALLRKDLRGRDLACWCPLDQPCHADVLLELANQDPSCPVGRLPAQSPRENRKTR